MEDEITKQMKRAAVTNYLDEESSAVLSTHAEDGGIDSVAVFFVADEDLNFYFLTKLGTRKYLNIMANPDVALTISNAALLKTVEVKGTASVVNNVSNIVGHIGSLSEKIKVHAPMEESPWLSTIFKLDAGESVAFKVTPRWLRYGEFSNELPPGEYFKQII